MDSVHTLGLGLGRTGAGQARIPYVLAGVQCLQGLEPGSSPTSGTVFPQVRGLFGVSSCEQCPHTLASDLMFRVCGVPDRPIRLWGVADYGGPRTAPRGPLWVFILVRPSVGFFAFTNSWWLGPLTT